MPNDTLSSIIGSDALLEGTFTLDGSVRIDGKFHGTLICKGTVTIGANSEFEGNIDAEEVILGGKVSGILIARSRLVLEATASLKGEVASSSLVIEEGAEFNGKSTMGPQAVERLENKLKIDATELQQEIMPNKEGIILFERGDGTSRPDVLAGETEEETVQAN